MLRAAEVFLNEIRDGQLDRVWVHRGVRAPLTAVASPHVARGDGLAPAAAVASCAESAVTTGLTDWDAVVDLLHAGKIAPTQ